MAHQDGWIELYGLIEEGKEYSQDLVDLCKSSRNGIGETMLHWYAIEGEPDVLQKLIDLGFNVNTQNDFGNTPIMECSQIGRWNNALILLENGVDLTIQNENKEDYKTYLEEYDIQLPDYIVNWIESNYVF